MGLRGLGCYLRKKVEATLPSPREHFPYFPMTTNLARYAMGPFKRDVLLDVLLFFAWPLGLRLIEEMSSEHVCDTTFLD
jgi:hypothetical protein